MQFKVEYDVENLSFLLCSVINDNVTSVRRCHWRRSIQLDSRQSAAQLHSKLPVSVRVVKSQRPSSFRRRFRCTTTTSRWRQWLRRPMSRRSARLDCRPVTSASDVRRSAAREVSRSPASAEPRTPWRRSADCPPTPPTTSRLPSSGCVGFSRGPADKQAPI